MATVPVTPAKIAYVSRWQIPHHQLVGYASGEQGPVVYVLQGNVPVTLGRDLVGIKNRAGLDTELYFRDRFPHYASKDGFFRGQFDEYSQLPKAGIDDILSRHHLSVTRTDEDSVQVCYLGLLSVSPPSHIKVYLICIFQRAQLLNIKSNQTRTQRLRKKLRERPARVIITALPRAMAKRRSVLKF